MFASLITTLVAVEAAAVEAADHVMDSTTLLISVSAVSLTFMGLVLGAFWHMIGLINSLRLENKQEFCEVHERIDELTDKFHAVDKDVAVLKDGSGRQGVQQA